MEEVEASVTACFQLFASEVNDDYWVRLAKSL